MDPQTQPPVVQSVNDLIGHVSVTVNQQLVVSDDSGGKSAKFLRVELRNVDLAVQSIVQSVANTSWISELVDDLVKESFLERARPTIDKLTTELTTAIGSGSAAADTVGEYIVSGVARDIIEAVYEYRALPLAELIKEQKSGNPGFDYHHEDTSLVLLFGEAKYVKSRNAYGRAFKQILDHIELKKDIKELVDLSHFMSNEAKENFKNGKKGFSAAFSTSGKSFDSDLLMEKILANADFNQLLAHESLIVVAVDIHD